MSPWLSHVCIVLAAGLLLACGDRPRGAQGESNEPAPRPIAGATADAVDGPRLALVIGNADYDLDDRLSLSSRAIQNSEDRGYLQDLANPVHDAEDVRAALQGRGFEVLYGEDLNRDRMIDLLDRFKRRVEQAGPNAVAIIYYAGHGIQIEGENVLLPAGANFQGAGDFTVMSSESVQAAFEGRGVTMTLLRSYLLQRGDRGVNIVILDACRNNPYNRSSSSGRSRGVRAARGLADVPWRLDRLIVAYSTAPGQVAYDGAAGDRNSPYTAVLKRYLTEATMTVSDLFNAVSNDVRDSTRDFGNGPQLPFVNSTTVPSICLEPCEVSTATPVRPVNLETPVGVGEVIRDSCDACPDMVVLAGGPFLQGSPEGEAGRDADEGPQMRAVVRPFAMSKSEITVGQWTAFVRTTGRQFDVREDCDWSSPGYRQIEAMPVVCVSWTDARDFASWLSQQTGRTYRLPTEAEWEYAARGGRTTRFWMGDSIGPDMANFAESSSIYAAPVGSYRPNPFGLVDMNGNVWEWSADCYAAYGAAVPSAGNCQAYAVRGGSWADEAAQVRSASRVSRAATLKDVNVGFRVATSSFVFR